MPGTLTATMETTMADGSGKTQEISLGSDFDAVVRYGGTTVELKADGNLVVKTNGNTTVYTNGDVKVRPAANDDAKAALQIGAIESTGEHKGEIYGGIYPADDKPIWFSAAPKVMDHYKAAAWATGQGGDLPTRKQGDYLTTLKGKGGAFTEIFNRGGSFPAGFVWLAEPNSNFRTNACCQRLSDGDQLILNRYDELPVLCVRR
jgi:hypothetical protein